VSADRPICDELRSRSDGRPFGKLRAGSRPSASANQDKVDPVTKKPVTIGVVSDTHGLLRPQAVEALRGSDRILHAGDVGAPEILEALAQIAPVTAIRGNVDAAPWARVLPATEVVEVNGISIYMLHDLAQLDQKPEAAGFRVIVYGHSHKQRIEEKNGVLYFNPGSAGPRRFSLPVSVGRLRITAGKIRAELIELAI
jgi:putative phosphoesterase